MKRTLLTAATLIVTAGLLAACDPEPGSPEWCAEIKKKAAGDITANEAAEFAKSCALDDLNDGLQNLLNQEDESGY